METKFYPSISRLIQSKLLFFQAEKNIYDSVQITGQQQQTTKIVFLTRTGKNGNKYIRMKILQTAHMFKGNKTKLCLLELMDP